MKHLLLLRHGETAHSSEGRYSGRVDYPLSERGRDQARSWRPLVEGLPIGLVIASPLSRAHETALLAGFAGVTIDERASEWDLGELEGLKAEDFRRENPSWSLVVDGPPHHSGESTAEVRERARSLVAMIEERSSDDVAVVVSHGQFLRVLATELLGLPLATASSLSLGPAHLAIVSRRARGLSLTGWNLSSHPDRDGLLTDLT